MSRRRILWLIAAILASAVLPLVTFKTMATPFDRFPGGRKVQFAIVGLDLPVAVLNRAYPEALRTHLTFFLRCSHTYCFPDDLVTEGARYLRAGFPAYMLLFHAPLAVRALLRRRKPSAGNRVPPSHDRPDS